MNETDDVNLPWLIFCGCFLLLCAFIYRDEISNYFYNEDKYFSCDGVVRFHLPYPEGKMTSTVHVQFQHGKGTVEIKSGEAFMFSDKHYVCQKSDDMMFFNVLSDPAQSKAICDTPNAMGASYGSLDLVSGKMVLFYGFTPKMTRAELVCKQAFKLLN